MRIAYGVHGYGRGHATRALTLLPKLMDRHEVHILAGADAFDLLYPEYPDAVQRVPTLKYYYNKAARCSKLATAVRNMPAVLDVVFHGPTFESVCETLRTFSPDVVISDAELWTHHAARRMGLPRISIDHYGIIAQCVPEISLRDKLRLLIEVLTYRWLVRKPERVIVSSFYPAPPRRQGVRVVAPLLRKEVLETRPSRGEHLLVYLNKAEHQFTPEVEKALTSLDCPAKFYGLEGRPSHDNITYRPLSNLPFVEDLASCRALVCTAGNQLVGEAMYFGKPMLVIPENTVEQRLNGDAVERLGIGRRVALEDVSAGVLQDFLAHEGQYRDNIERIVHGDWVQGVEAVTQYLDELAGPAADSRTQQPAIHENA